MTLNISILNIFLPVVILLYNWKVNRNAIYLSLLLFLIATSNVRHALVMHAKDPFWLAIISNNLTPLWTLIGPCLYFYVRGVLSDRFEWKKKDLLHTIPFWINLIGIIPYLFTSFDYKLQVAELMISNLELYRNIRVNWLMPQPVNLTFRAILQIGYAIACMVMLARYARPLKPRKDRPRRQSDFVFPWLWSLTIFVFLIAAYYLLIVGLYYQNPTMGRRLMFEYQMVYVLGGALTFLPFLIILSPEIMYGIPKYRPSIAEKAAREASIARQQEDAEKNTIPQPLEQRDKIPGEQDPFRELEARIHQLMQEEKPYLREDFSLEDLARKLDVPKHHIHYCLRNIMQTKFVSLRIAYRIAHAKKLLLQSDLQNMTLEQIGLECGFSSRSGFYKMFKAEVGCSPGEFIEKYRPTGQA